MTTSTEIERVDPMATLVQASYYDQIDKQQLAMLKATRMRTLDDAEVGVALEMCRTMGLNPWNDEMYAAKGNNGELLLMVGRNGLLRKAEEFPDYLGYDSGVVHRNDQFSKGDPNPDGRSLRERAGVSHRQTFTDRGEIIGSWCVAERAGRPLRFFFAPVEDYRPSSPHPKSSWFRFPTVMIEKCAISVAHRTLINLSGVYLREEVDKLLEREDGEPVRITREEEWEGIQEAVAASDASEDVRERLLSAMDAMNVLSPGAWGLGKVQMVIPGRSAEELARQADQLEADVARLIPQHDPEPEITDAEVVEPKDAKPSALERLEITRDEIVSLLEQAESDEEREDLTRRIGKVDEAIAALPET